MFLGRTALLDISNGTGKEIQEEFIMNKTELVAAIAEQAEISKKDAEKALKAFTDVVAEELKKGVKAFNINGGLIEWLHFDGYGQKTILSGLATVISPTKRRKRSTWLRRDLPVWCLLASRPCIPIVLVSSFQTSPCVMGIMSEL